MEALIEKIYKLKSEKEAKEAESQKLKDELSNIDNLITEASEQLLSLMKTKELNEYQSNNLFVNKFSRENIGYKDEKEVIAWLKANNNEFIKTKITESIDKTALKKAIKTNNDLAKALDSMTERTLTEYVVVTDAENHQKMLEHIEGNSK